MNNLQVADQDQNQSNYFNIQLLGHVAHVKLNRPEKRNAMNWDFWRDLPRIIGDIDRNSSARCIVLSSTGPIFSAGLDLSLFGQDVFSSSTTNKKNEKELQTPQNFMNSFCLSYKTLFHHYKKLEFPLFVQYRVAV